MQTWMQMRTDEAGQRGRMWMQHRKFSSEMWKNINQPSHFQRRYMILAGYWLAIRMWEVSFSSLSLEMGFSISRGVHFFFSHGRKFRDGNGGPCNGLSVKHFWSRVKYLTMKFGIDIHDHQMLNLLFMYCSNTNKSKLTFSNTLYRNISYMTKDPSPKSLLYFD